MRKEREIQLAVCKYLSLKRYFFHRMNNIGVYDAQRGVFRTNHYGIKGVPDIYVYLKGQIVALEIKSETGRQSPKQKQFKEVFTWAGGLYYVIRSLDDVVKAGL